MSGKMQQVLSGAKQVGSAAMTGNKKVADMTHEVIEPGSSHATTDHGVKIGSHDDWLRVSSADRTGAMLLEDQIAREKIHRFDHERIPERVVHARGAGAFGTFKLFESAADVTSAKVLTDTSRTTPLFLRFSTVAGSRGSADTVRDVRGFAIKFYTDEGNWDIVGNDIPVFFIQDAIKFPDFVHSAKPEPDNEVPQAQTAHNNFWDFQYMHEETTHMFMWAMSDRGIPRSYRMMQGFGVNTFSLINAKGERSLVKFHFTPELGVHSFVWDEALKIAGQDPDFHRKDLWEAIENGAYPKWKFGIQTIPESQQDDFDFDPLDATKLWPEELIPVRYIGELELNRNPDEYFTQVEQIAFCTSHIVPGIDFSDDPLLQGRNFSYFDTQLSRLGTNWQELPINRPVCPVMNVNRDGAMKHRIHKGKINYHPNRYDHLPAATPEEGGFHSYPEKVMGTKTRLKSRKFQEHISQAQLFYNSLAPHEKTHLQAALSFELDHCDEEIVYKRMTQRLADIDFDLATSVAEMVGGDPPPKDHRPNHGKKSAFLSQTHFEPKNPTISTRRVAILIADGFDLAPYEAVKAALTAAGALPFTIAPRRHEIFPAGTSKSKGSGVMADHHFEGQRSTMFDSVFVAPGAASIKTLQSNGRVIHWVREAFGHCKAIGAIGDGVELVREACASLEIKIASASSKDVVSSYGVVTAGSFEIDSLKAIKEMVVGSKNFIESYAYNIAQHRNYQREMDGLTMKVAY